MNSGITVKLRFFAGVREQLGCADETVTLPSGVKTVGQVRAWLISRGGVWADTFALDRNLRMASQLTLCEPEDEIDEGHEVAFFPPVTGG